MGVRVPSSAQIKTLKAAKLKASLRVFIINTLNVILLDILLEKNSGTEAVIKINLKESDYQSKLKEKLKSYSKQAQIKGFRPGKVPVALIEKMYGKSIKVEQINEILVESLKEYIKKNDIKIIGDPLPNNDKMKDIDWDIQTDFDFEYSIGLVDDFQYDLNVKVNKYEIEVDEKEVNKVIQELQERYGKMTNPEISGDSDSIFGTLGQESSQFSKDCLLEIPAISKKLQKKFVGVSKTDAIKFDIQKLFEKPADLEVITGLGKDEADALADEFMFTVKNINHTEPAAMNQEFFDKIFGEGKVKTEEEFIAEYTKIFQENHSTDSEYLLSHQLQKELLKEVKINIPEEFYKRWIQATNPELNDESIEKDFEHYIRDLKWTLLKNRIASDNDIKIEYPDIVAYTIKMFARQFGIPEVTEEMAKNLEAMATNYLQQKDGQNYMNVYNQLMTERVMEVVKQKANLKIKKVSREEFNKIAES